jgi:hypothetical protein
VFPTCVGMNRSTGRPPNSSSCVPHTRGDESPSPLHRSVTCLIVSRHREFNVSSVTLPLRQRNPPPIARLNQPGTLRCVCNSKPGSRSQYGLTKSAKYASLPPTLSNKSLHLR